MSMTRWLCSGKLKNKPKWDIVGCLTKGENDLGEGVWITKK